MAEHSIRDWRVGGQEVIAGTSEKTAKRRGGKERSRSNCRSVEKRILESLLYVEHCMTTTCLHRCIEVNAGASAEALSSAKKSNLSSNELANEAETTRDYSSRPALPSCEGLYCIADELTRTAR